LQWSWSRIGHFVTQFCALNGQPVSCFSFSTELLTQAVSRSRKFNFKIFNSRDSAPHRSAWHDVYCLAHKTFRG
jgi:hypothetical protein